MPPAVQPSRLMSVWPEPGGSRGMPLRGSQPERAEHGQAVEHSRDEDQRQDKAAFSTGRKPLEEQEERCGHNNHGPLDHRGVREDREQGRPAGQGDPHSPPRDEEDKGQDLEPNQLRARQVREALEMSSPVAIV